MVAKKKPKMTSQLVKRLLRERFDDSRRYAIAEEVGNATGMEQSRRMDMVVCDCYKSNRFAIEGIEVKVSKSDLRRELEDSSKHNIFYPALTYYSLAAPADIIDIDMLPPKWGVYAVYTFDDKPPILRAMRKPLDLHDEEVESISKPFAMCLMRAIACQSPTHAQLRDARQEGYDAGYQAAERQFESRRTRDGLDDFPSDEWNHLRECLSAMHFTDRIVFGRWNYNKEMPRDVDDLDEWYAVGANIVRRFCRANGIECVIKKGTAKDV